MIRLLVLALPVLATLGCADGPSRPPPPTGNDAGADPDAASELDAGPLSDAATSDPDASDGAGSETLRRDYGTDFDVCPPFQYPVWGDLRWDATIPDGATIRFSAQAAAEGDSLGGARRVTLGTAPPAVQPLYVSDELPEAHRNDPQLRISALLRWPAPDARPTLDSVHLDWVCLDEE